MSFVGPVSGLFVQVLVGGLSGLAASLVASEVLNKQADKQPTLVKYMSRLMAVQYSCTWINPVKAACRALIESHKADNPEAEALAETKLFDVYVSTYQDQWTLDPPISLRAIQKWNLANEWKLEEYHENENGHVHDDALIAKEAMKRKLIKCVLAGSYPVSRCKLLHALCMHALSVSYSCF